MRCRYVQGRPCFSFCRGRSGPCRASPSAALLLRLLQPSTSVTIFTPGVTRPVDGVVVTPDEGAAWGPVRGPLHRWSSRSVGCHLLPGMEAVKFHFQQGLPVEGRPWIPGTDTAFLCSRRPSLVERLFWTPSTEATSFHQLRGTFGRYMERRSRLYISFMREQQEGWLDPV